METPEPTFLPIEPPESDHEEPEESGSKPETPKRDDMIRLSTSRRGSTSFLTSDDTVVISFQKGRRLSSICTASSYDA